jgi:hypothetical protein
LKRRLSDLVYRAMLDDITPVEREEPMPTAA